MGFLFKRSDSDTADNRNFRELKKIKKSLATNGKKPEVKLSRNIAMSYDTFTTQRNTNVLLIGNREEDKLNKHIAPNINSFNRSYIITDLDNTIYDKYKVEFESRGYTVSLYDLKEPAKSGYNPMAYVYDERSAYHLAYGIMNNVGSDAAKDSKGMWEDAELKLLSALIWAVSEKKENTVMNDVIEMLSAGAPKLDELFKTANAKALAEYNKLKNDISPETQKGVILSLKDRLSIFSTWDSGLTKEECAADMKEFVFGRKAMFINISKSDEYGALAGIIVRQIITAIEGEMNTLGIFRPQYPLHFILNPVDRIGKICDFEELLENTAQPMFAFSLIASSVTKLETAYGENWEKAVAGRCDAFVCLSNADNATAKWFGMEYDDLDDSLPPTENEDVMEAAKSLEETRVLVKVRGFKPVTDDI